MTLSPQELHGYLSALVRRDLTVSTMIWGPPGVGKSSIVSQVARELGLEFTDVRLSQLAPTDLRGLPVAENGVSRWFPPEFLPRSGRGVLFLDELNMAPPTMQGMAQQLILDRRVGSYALPDGWFVWAAGNRKEDRASVFDMPAPLANRFVHLEVRPDFAAWRAYAHAARIHPHVIAFLMYRSELLHALDPARPAWPSPRSWSVASDLHAADLDVAPAIGEGAAAEFMAFAHLYGSLPDLERVLAGEATNAVFPAEPSASYATVTALADRAGDADRAARALGWLTAASPEWTQLFVTHLVGRLQATGQLAALTELMERDAALTDLVHRTLTGQEA
ncbi:ATP-binding protein [Deinococcus hopiensis]|uniref:MoxR-like ATPase n=1 Tax=Deinococcus hopiensis KR-140 TaxID=695939 RepID=A0A1W1UTM2_9DEIO|nr:MoxR family ATPase [Deinococcus hopiensis]SMB84498.1 MoxR-like ATPase [Deinococcus hopiensis KR-140]